MKFSDFQQRVNVSKQDICREAFVQNRRLIRIKKEMTAVKNLTRIFDATLRISNKKGFQAMTMRDLSRESGLSMGALYAYFSSKEELLEMLQRVGRTITKRVLEEGIGTEPSPLTRLRAAVKTHIYLSEVMQPWFYFSYMEAKNLGKKESEKAVAGELYTEKLIMDIISEGQKQGCFRAVDPRLTASLIKAMLQDWYLKRGKYRGREISVDHYTSFVLDMVEAFCLASPRQDP